WRGHDRECSWPASLDRIVEPAMRADPGDRVASAKVEHVRAAAEGVHPRTRACVRPLKSPATGEREGVRAAQDEVDDALRIAGTVVPHPEVRASVSGIER